MTKSHNKKRNVGIIYELLLRYVSSSLVSENREKAQVALDILEKRFSPECELYKEFRLFNALANSTVSNTSIAAGILSEAKAAARRCDEKALERDKHLLIKDINYQINDVGFYHQRVPEYKIYATIQTLLNDWRKNDNSSLSRVIQYESKVVERLLEEKRVNHLENQNSPNADDLVVKLMMEKFNNKYGKRLNPEQKEIIKTYVFSIVEDSGEKIKVMLENLRRLTVKNLDDLKSETENQILLEKINVVKEKVTDVNLEKINDVVISKFLTVSQLKNEILEAE
jgi:hypothetical protein|tara:strand:- start:712 stop:1560 length:849 start_codon:yes stop_codon:yes gene_type:complete